MECKGKTEVELIDNITNDDKLKIFDTFNNRYGDSDFIDYVDDFNFIGDMGCLCVFGTGIVRDLKEKNLISCIKTYNIINTETNEKEILIYNEI